MSQESAKEFVHKIRFMHEMMESLRKANEKEREIMIRDAGFDFTFNEVKHALSEYEVQLVGDIYSGGIGGSLEGSHFTCRTAVTICGCYS